MDHDPERACSCEICQRLDVMYGDPKLTAWERRFVASVAEWGGRGWYTERQKVVVLEVFERARSRWSQAGSEGRPIGRLDLRGSSS